MACAPRGAPLPAPNAPAAAATVASSAGGTPAAGLVPALQDTVRRTLLAGLEASAYPGAYAIVGTADRVLAEVGVGQLDITASPAPDAATLWDLASLTKGVATTSAVMQLVEQHRVELVAPADSAAPAPARSG